jgi:hypothetical protein
MADGEPQEVRFMLPLDGRGAKHFGKFDAGSDGSFMSVIE